MSNKTFKTYVDKMGATTATDYIGKEGELFYDSTTTTLRIADGVTAGGTIVSTGPTETQIVNISEAAPGAASGTFAYNGSNGVRVHVHTAVPTGNWNANLTNLGLATNEATNVRIIVPGAASDYTMTPTQIDGSSVGVTNTSQTLKASKTKTNVFDLQVVKTGASAYTIYGLLTAAY